MKRFLIISLCLASLALTAKGQSNWGLRTNIGVEKKIAKGLDAGFDARYHLTDNFKQTDRWSVGVSLSKRLYRNEAKTFSVKAGLGYKYMKVHHDWSTRFKGDSTLAIADNLEPQYYISNKYSFNYADTYVDSRQRITASLQAGLELGRFKISLREAYQFTHTDSVSYSVDRYRYSTKDRTDKGYDQIAGTNFWVRNDMEGKSASNSNVLRSKLSVDYDIPHCKFDPFISYELFNNIDENLKSEKSRITAGVEFSFNKQHDFEVAYMWQNQHDNDEPAGSFICLSYKFEF